MRSLSKLSLYRLCAYALALLASGFMALNPLAAQSILRDAETEALLRDMAAPLIEASELEPGNVEIVLINDPSINAFVAGGQVVYVHAGLLNAADSANEVQGVIAHELGHITAGHVVRFEERTRAASGITILSLLLGVGAALAGAGDAAIGAIMAGQRAALGSFLAFNRDQEASTDLAGARYLSGAGISGRGMLTFFDKLRDFELRRGYSQGDEQAYTRTHPLSGDRIETLRGLLQEDDAWETPDDPELQERFLRVRAKLYGYLAEPQRTLAQFPESDTSIPARYARAYAFHKEARVDKALAETEALLAYNPENPYFLELEGQILLESGRPVEALVPLRKATGLTHVWPRPDRDRERGQLRRGRAGAARGGGKGPAQPVCMVSARRGLRRAGRSSARAPCKRRTAGHDAAFPRGAAQRAGRRGRAAGRLIRLDPCAGRGVAGPRRTGTHPRQPLRLGTPDPIARLSGP